MTRYQKFIYLIFAIYALIYSVGFAFERYIRVKENNLDVVEKIVSCARAEQFAEEAYKKCADRAKANLIFQRW
jgi:hypothetical protein